MRNRAAEIRTTTDTPGRCSSPCKYARLGIRHTHRDARETISGPAGNRLTPRSDLRVRYKNYSPTVRSSTPVSRSDIRLIQYLDSSVHGLARRWRLTGYFPILYYPEATTPTTPPRLAFDPRPTHIHVHTRAHDTSPGPRDIAPPWSAHWSESQT